MGESSESAALVMDRSTLKLHPGSFWNNGGVTSECGNEVWVADGLLDVNGLDSVEIADALAVIRDAGLDPEFEELEETRTEIARLTLNAQMDAQIIQAVRETCHDFENRLEAANKTISEMQNEIDRLVRSEGTIW